MSARRPVVVVRPADDYHRSSFVATRMSARRASHEYDRGEEGVFLQTSSKEAAGKYPPPQVAQKDFFRNRNYSQIVSVAAPSLNQDNWGPGATITIDHRLWLLE